MSLFHAILLGLLQGLTEFLPVSSTAHMAIVPQLLGWGDPGAAFSAIVQLGPIVAIVSYFWRDLSRYIAGMFGAGAPKNFGKMDLDARLGWFTLLGTLPIIVFGVLLKHRIESTFRGLYFIAFSLIALALVLVWAEMVGKRKSKLDKLTLKQSQVIGWAQVLALVPGTSRSGVTITAGLFEGLTRESAARFSFLLSIPAIVAAGLFELYGTLRHTKGLREDIGPYLLAAVVAGVVAYLVIKWFLGFMKEHTTGPFIIYRIALGVLLIVLLQMHVLNPRTSTAQTRSDHASVWVAALSR